MNCDEFQELVSGYLDNELTRRETKRLLTHFEHCSYCKGQLGTYSVQKEAVSTLRSSYLGPLPSPEFAAMVMVEINQEDAWEKESKSKQLLPSIYEMVLSLVRKPAFAIVCALLVIVGTVSSRWWDDLTPWKGEKKLMSVYELQAHRGTREDVRVVKAGREEASLVFHHMAQPSCETFAAKRCLLEYTAYTPASYNY